MKNEEKRQFYAAFLINIRELYFCGGFEILLKYWENENRIFNFLPFINGSRSI